MDAFKNYSLYILKLEQDKYYIGITTMRDPLRRIEQHKTGFFSSQWTKKYRYLETVSIENLGNITEKEAFAVENNQTLLLMKQYGYQNVRGGKFNYSGNYVKVGSRYFRDEEWKTLLVVLFMMFALLVALVQLIIK